MLTGTTIRRLSAKDVVAYRALRQLALTTTPTAFTSSADEERDQPDARFLAQICPPEGARSLVMGAFEAGKDLVGVAGLRIAPERQAAHKGTLFGMAVLAAASGRGIGRALVAAILDEGLYLGLRQVGLTYTLGNAPAERLYKRCGFQEFGREPRAVIVKGEDIIKVHMIRWLDR